MVCGPGPSKSRLMKIANCCGVKHMSKSKWQNAPFSRRFLKCTQTVARSRFRSQNVQNTSASERFWKFRCSKSPRCCGAKMREAHFKAKMLKTLHCWTTFGRRAVQKAHALLARSTCRSETAKNTTCSDHFWTFKGLFS